MKIDITFIRHGKTMGNTLGRYIGVTDEELCDIGREELLVLQAKGCYPAFQDIFQIYESPMLRCRQTRELLYPLSIHNEETERNHEKTGFTDKVCQVSGLRECNFGEFENKNYKELNGNKNYQRWIDSNGILPFPGGESREEFIERTSAAFLWCVEDMRTKWKANPTGKIPKAVFVVHGGTIMAVLHRFGGRGYFDCQLKNGQALKMEYCNGILSEKGNPLL